MLDLCKDLCNTWEVGNLQRYLAHLLEVVPFSQPSNHAFSCLHGLACTPLLHPRFSVAVDVALRVRAKVAPDYVQQRHQKMLRELSPEDVLWITGWTTFNQLSGVPAWTVPNLWWILQCIGNTTPVRDHLWY